LGAVGVLRFTVEDLAAIFRLVERATVSNRERALGKTHVDWNMCNALDTAGEAQIIHSRAPGDIADQG
jgi:hypothetical protein